jgi:hypothetical protein
VGTATDSERVAALARQVVADRHPRLAPFLDPLGACHDAGLPRAHLPQRSGALGVSRELQAIADSILQDASGPVPLTLRPMEYG